MNGKARTWAFLAIFACGAGIRALDLFHGVDGGIRESWREADYGAVARNFYREDPDILRPRIDWRGDGPGLAEMEFPAVPWLTSQLYRVFGEHEFLGRIVSYVFGLLTLLVFFALASRLLPVDGAVFAGAFLALAPLAVRISNALQPESLMLFFYVLAVFLFWRWLEKETAARYGFALLATAACVLTKMTAAHIGILLALLVLDRRGWKGLLRFKVAAFGFFSLLPAVAWYFHAHRFWLAYGNSLGVSNEAHWLGWDMIANPRWLIAALVRLLRMEGTLTAMLPGLFIVMIVLWAKRRDSAIRLPLYWLVAIGVYYVAAIRTTGDYWASYYHVVSVIPVALVLGLGFSALAERFHDPRAPAAAAAAAFLAGTALIALKALGALPFPRFSVMTALILVLSGGGAVMAAKAGLSAARAEGERRRTGLWSAAFSIAGLAAFLALFPLEGFQTARDLHPSKFAALQACAVSFKPLIPEGSLILASGGPSRDETGKPIAFNASYMFYWLDRKGFNIPSDRQTLESVAGFIRRGARYFVLEKEALAARPEFEGEIRRAFPLVAECPAACLFRLAD